MPQDKEKLTAEIISIGTEILLGDIVNTNAAFLSREMAGLGIDTFHQQVVGDNPLRLKAALQKAFEEANLVITSGGLGPTEDDLSKETGAEYFGVPLIMDEKARSHIETYMKRRGKTITENNWKQALLPEGATPFYNQNGTAPGFALEKDGKTLIMLPGPPSEIVPMFLEQVAGYLRRRSGNMMISRTLHICGVGESTVESILYDKMISMRNPTLAPYAKEGIVDLRITAKAETEEEARRMIDPVEKEIRDIFQEAVFGCDEETLESTVVRLLTERNLTLSTAESCTGGLVAGRIVNVPGASAVFMGGLITYANEAKEAQLYVRKETLAAHGAVSEETAAEMAEGAAKALHTDIAISTTGVAGPDGGTEEKPVGMVCFGLYVKGKVTTSTAHFGRRRNANRELASVMALDLIRRALLKLD